MKDCPRAKVQYGEVNKSQLQQSRGPYGGHKFEQLISKRIGTLYSGSDAEVHFRIKCKMHGRLETPKLKLPKYNWNLGYPKSGNAHGYGVFVVPVSMKYDYSNR
jgi:hypothetical protein